jgi:diaminopimelate decarboxylase
MLKLAPRIATEAQSYITAGNLLKQLLRTYGSPLNIMLPSVAVTNYQAFEDVFSSYALKHKIYIAVKANKSQAILKRMAFTNACVDVASTQELIDALAAGFSGNRIEATGPKNQEFLKLCIAHDVQINVDDYNELVQIEAICEKLFITNKQVGVYLRLSIPYAFYNKCDRFGNPTQQFEQSCDFIKSTRHIKLTGLSFHFSTDKIYDRVKMISYTLEKVIALQKETHPNFQISHINIGGGYLINYVASKEEWHAFQTTIRESVLAGEQNNLSWNKFGFGYNVDKNTLKGTKSFVDMYQSVNAQAVISEILTTHNEEFGSSLADIIRDLNLTICIEPGQSFFDQTGFTLASVMNIKKTEKGLNLLVLDMNRSNINAGDSEYLLDPIIISNSNGENGVTDGFLVGNLCLPSDLISRRRFYFERPVAIGDVLLFCNTAPYLMDFSESNTLKQKIAPKIALVEDKNESTFMHFTDTSYTHL